MKLSGNAHGLTAVLTVLSSLTSFVAAQCSVAAETCGTGLSVAATAAGGITNLGVTAAGVVGIGAIAPVCETLCALNTQCTFYVADSGTGTCTLYSGPIGSAVVNCPAVNLGATATLYTFSPLPCGAAASDAVVPSNSVSLPSISPSPAAISDILSIIPSVSDVLSVVPSVVASNVVSDILSVVPSNVVSVVVSIAPSGIVSDILSVVPSNVISDVLSVVPSIVPSNIVSNVLSVVPSNVASDILSVAPSNVVSGVLSVVPSIVPSNVVSDILSVVPSNVVSDIISDVQSIIPSNIISGAISIGPVITGSSIVPSVAVSDVLSVVQSGIPSNVISGILSGTASNSAGTGVSSILLPSVSIPSISLPISSDARFLVSGLLFSITLPSDSLPSASLPSASLPSDVVASISLSSAAVLPTISLPSLDLSASLPAIQSSDASFGGSSILQGPSSSIVLDQSSISIGLSSFTSVPIVGVSQSVPVIPSSVIPSDILPSPTCAPACFGFLNDVTNAACPQDNSVCLPNGQRVLCVRINRVWTGVAIVLPPCQGPSSAAVSSVAPTVLVPSNIVSGVLPPISSVAIASSLPSVPTLVDAVDGRCGIVNGVALGCAPGFCCSQFGYCGRSDAYCGIGCQIAYGTCPRLSDGTVPTNQNVSPDFTCGPGSAGNYACPTGLCCSQYGWCGLTDAYCGTGCLVAYGSCSVTVGAGAGVGGSVGSGSGTSAGAGGGAGTNISLDYTCGAGSANQRSCPTGYCCSQYGWCGLSDAYCGAGCQLGFGTCGA